MNDQPYIYFNKPSHYNGSIRFELSYVPTRNVMISCTFAKVALGLAIPATIWKIEDNLYMHITISTYLKQIDPAQKQIDPELNKAVSLKIKKNFQYSQFINMTELELEGKKTQNK